MASWSEILEDINKNLPQNSEYLNQTRKKFVADLAAHTGRNVIVYYSNWLKMNNQDVAINDKDKNAFMATVHKLDRKKGLDLLLHTPGGDLAATESIVDYLHQMFGNDIRAIIPQIAMSAGTMVAFSCKEIIMGTHSNLGPIDPQLNGVPCQSVLEEFKTAKNEVIAEPRCAPVWQPIIAKYPPTFLVECDHAIKWSEDLAQQWLARNMCGGDTKKAQSLLKGFRDHKEHKSHSRHISALRCKEIGLNITHLESDQTLQDLVLSIHHAYMITFDRYPSIKIVENQIGTTWGLTQPQQMNILQNIQIPKQLQDLMPKPATTGTVDTAN